MPADIHLLTVDHTTFCGARVPAEWDRSAFTLKGAVALASHSRVVCSFCARAWDDPDSAGIRALSEREEAK